MGHVTSAFLKYHFLSHEHAHFAFMPILNACPTQVLDNEDWVSRPPQYPPHTTEHLHLHSRHTTGKPHCSILKAWWSISFSLLFFVPQLPRRRKHTYLAGYLRQQQSYKQNSPRTYCDSRVPECKPQKQELACCLLNVCSPEHRKLSGNACNKQCSSYLLYTPGPTLLQAGTSSPIPASIKHGIEQQFAFCGKHCLRGIKSSIYPAMQIKIARGIIKKRKTPQEPRSNAKGSS